MAELRQRRAISRAGATVMPAVSLAHKKRGADDEVVNYRVMFLLCTAFRIANAVAVRIRTSPFDDLFVRAVRQYELHLHAALEAA